MFDKLFGKHKKHKKEQEESKKAAIEDSGNNAADGGETVDEARCLDMVFRLLDEGIAEEHRTEEGRVIVPALRAVITPVIGSINGDGSRCAAHVYYWVEHPFFDEPLFESSSGLGTLEKALTMSVSGFLMGAVCGLRHFVKQEYIETFQTSLQGKEHLWHVSDSCGIELLGKAEKDDGEPSLWELIREALPEYLGCKRVYWIKAYCCKQAFDGTASDSGTAIGEVRINNAVCPELSEILRRHAQGFHVEEGLRSDKNFYYLTQDPDTCEPYPYTKEEVETAVAEAVSIFTGCIKEKNYESYYELLLERIQDEMLASELFAFLPEICAKDAFPEFAFPDQVGIRAGGEEELLKARVTQFTAYEWMARRVIDGFASGEFDKEMYTYMVSVSATYAVISQAEEKNAELDASNFYLCFGMCGGYRIR